MISDHKAEAVSDLRRFYHVSLWDVPLRELWLLVHMLMRDPGSWLHAAVAGWDYPVSREWSVLVDLVDVQMASKSKRKPKPYPRPFDAASTRRMGQSSVKRTPDELRALLNSVG